MDSRSREKKEREQEALRKQAAAARCAYCGKQVTMEDRCEDGIYLHRECAYKASAVRPA
jgi:hypothetical protein